MKIFQKKLTVDVMKKFQKYLTVDVMKKFQKKLTFDVKKKQVPRNTDSSCICLQFLNFENLETFLQKDFEESITRTLRPFKGAAVCKMAIFFMYWFIY